MSLATRQRRITPLITPLFALAILAVLSGCVQRLEQPDKRLFLIDLDERPTSATMVADERALPPIEVRMFQIASEWQDQEFVYRVEDDIYQTDYFNAFLVGPRENITNQALRWLRRSRAFEAALTPGSRARPGLTLDGTIVELYGDYRDAADRRAILTLHLIVTINHPDGPEILINKEYRSAVPISDNSRAQLVNGWSQGLSEALSNFLHDLRRSSEI